MLEYEWFYSNYNWRIFEPNSLEDFSSHCSSIFGATGGATTIYAP
jgi:hypothetical protein